MSLQIRSVEVIHGSDAQEYNLGGKTVAEAIEVLNNEIYDGTLAGLVVLLNGERLEDAIDGEDTMLETNDTLTFMSRGGDKG
jgi:hypothetical protein